jgi:hypothetical protein
MSAALVPLIEAIELHSVTEWGEWTRSPRPRRGAVSRRATLHKAGAAKHAPCSIFRNLGTWGLDFSGPGAY